MLFLARDQTHPWTVPQAGCAIAGCCFSSHSANTAACQPDPGLRPGECSLTQISSASRVAASPFSLLMVLKNMLCPSFTHCPVITSNRRLPKQRLCGAGHLQDSEWDPEAVPPQTHCLVQTAGAASDRQEPQSAARLLWVSSKHLCKPLCLNSLP